MFLIIPFSIYLLLLLGVSVGLLKSRTKSLAFILFALISIPFVIIGTSWLNSPVNLEKQDIIGQYEIAQSIYPESQADWQYRTYTLDVTPTELIVYDSRTEKTWKSPITWLNLTDYRWKFANDSSRHHIIQDGPAIYRTDFSYYYVFKSPLYGNVFFRKKRDLPSTDR